MCDMENQTDQHRREGK